MRTGGSRKDRVFKISLRMPAWATEDEVMDYIEDAVCGWQGGLSNDDPMRALDRDTVVVKRASPKYGEIIARVKR